MDKRIQDAAGNHLPPFQENDWEGMELLLNKHLPQEKKKRPFLFGLLFLLLAGVPVLLMLTTYKRPPSMVAQKINTTVPVHSFDSTTRGLNKTSVSSTAGGEREETDIADKPVANIPEDVSRSSSSSPLPADRTKHRGERQRNDRQKRSVIPTVNNSKEKEQGNEIAAVADPLPAPAITKGENIPSNITQGNAVDTGANTDQMAADSLPKKDSSLQGENEPVAKNKTPEGRKPGKLQINLSAGPDLSTVGIEKTGQWKMQYGIGLSYALSGRFQVRTGFLVSRKLYTADSSDYHPPKNFWSYYPNLQKIDANCLVYEIPLNIVYTFPSVKKHQWFVSAGVSSYLMKEENYEYYYKDAWGQIVSRSRAIQNENDHFFSILQLSGGYQYKFSDRLSLMAEPYFKLPIGGVGFGKVKLNNTGLLFTLGYKPFSKR